MKKKLLFVSFQGIRKGIPSGVVKFLYPLINEMRSSDDTIKIKYLIGHTDSNDENIQAVSHYYGIIVKIINRINRLFNLVQVYKRRLIQERIFDLFVSFRIKEPVYLMSAAYLKRSTDKNRRLGGVNLFLAGNPDDYDIYQLLINEMNKYDISINDPYTHKERIQYVMDSISSFDHIITFTIIEYQSYLKRIQPQKASYIESHIIPNKMVFPHLDTPKKNNLTFCFISHPFWLKGLPYLLEAWSKLDNNGAILKIGGRINGELQEYIDKYYSDLKNIEYLGWVDDLNLFFRSSNVCIVPSLLDAGPATVAEAMYCELPVIVSDGCGAQTLVKEGGNGFVVPASDSNAIAEKMKWFIENRDEIPLMGNNASAIINQLEECNQYQKVAEHILNILNKYEK